jgi:signal transduction histidine kinase
MRLAAARDDAAHDEAKSTARQKSDHAVDHAALQERLNTVELELQHARRAHEEARRSKAEFIANISHELRTPLQTIIGFSELGASVAHSRVGHSDYEDMFGDICAGGQRMLSLVNVLLDVASLSSSVGSLSLQRVELIELIECVVSATKSRAQGNTQLGAFELDLSFAHPPAPLWAWVDTTRLQQVLSNVLTNAQRFAGQAGIQIACTEHENTGITITIRDHGPGIPADELEAVFEPFFQSSRTRNGSGGIGLGLTVCRKIMGAHGGSIHAANAQDGGCVISIHLPHSVNAQDSAPSGVQR